MRARSAMSWIRAPWKPRSAKTASAASRLALRKSARASSRRRGSRSGATFMGRILIHLPTARNPLPKTGRNRAGSGTGQALEPAPGDVDPGDPEVRAGAGRHLDVGRGVPGGDGVACDEGPIGGHLAE